MHRFKINLRLEDQAEISKVEIAIKILEETGLEVKVTHKNNKRIWLETKTTRTAELLIYAAKLVLADVFELQNTDPVYISWHIPNSRSTEKGKT